MTAIGSSFCGLCNPTSLDCKSFLVGRVGCRAYSIKCEVGNNREISPSPLHLTLRFNASSLGYLWSPTVKTIDKTSRLVIVAKPHTSPDKTPTTLKHERANAKRSEPLNA